MSDESKSLLEIIRLLGYLEQDLDHVLSLNDKYDEYKTITVFNLNKILSKYNLKIVRKNAT